MTFYEEHKKRMRGLLVPPTKGIPLIEKLREAVRRRKPKLPK